MRKPIFIYGAGGLGREVLALIRRLEHWEPMGFIDDGMKKDTTIAGLQVVGGGDFLSELAGRAVVFALGTPLVKREIALRSRGLYCPTLVDPSAIVLSPESVKIGQGTIVCAGAILTSDIEIGDHVLINLNATLGHDSKIGSYSSIMPGVNIAGQVSLGDAVLLGSGSNIRNGVVIGAACRVGMGAVVVKNVESGITVVGVPARPLAGGSL